METIDILHTDGLARRGRLKLAHGTVETPVFMPVGTYGVVKTLSPEDLERLGAQIILGNTFHLSLRPGPELLKQVGGVHRFMGWQRPILTDSGGFQVFSLVQGLKLNDEGAEFRSPLNGDRIFLTPELSAGIQQAIGSDVAMVLDECVSLPNTDAAILAAAERSLRWARRFLAVPRLEGQRLFGIAQGGASIPLRLESLAATCDLPIDGIAIGGLSVGEPHETMVEVLEALAPKLPSHIPHYLMGVGTPLDLLEAVAHGIDMFDCVLPTRNARNGGFFTSDGLLNIRNQRYRDDQGPIETGCQCPCCSKHSRAYLRHLFQIKEILGCRLATLHNLHYYFGLIHEMRGAIESGTFSHFYRTLRPRLMAAYPGRRMSDQELEIA